MSTNAVITPQGNTAPLPTLLGQQQPRIPTGGKIRPGVKVLTKAAEGNPQAQAIYQEGLKAGQSFEQIEQELAKALPKLKNPLAPRNVPWFTVREQDFPNPEVARQILEIYGEDRGEGKRLYRFPALFPSDIWQSVMPHELVCWGTNDKRFWSAYSPDGHARHCMCFAPVPTDHTGQRAIRLFGGRKAVMREDNGGICNPEGCPQFQSHQCNLSGRFIFFIPGICTMNALELPTNSFYAMSHAIQRFQAIAHMQGGRIAGFLGRNRATFYFSKVLRKVPHIDESGRAVRVQQWIIELEAPIDVTALLRDGEDEEAAIRQADFSARALEGPALSHAPLEPKGNGLELDSPPKPQANPTLEQVLACIKGYGIEAERFMEYAASRWGTGWKVNVHGRKRVWDEIARFQNDPEGYADKIDAALGAAA